MCPSECSHVCRITEPGMLGLDSETRTILGSPDTCVQLDGT